MTGAERFAVHLPAATPVGPESLRRAYVVSGGRGLLTPARLRDSVPLREKVEAIIDFLDVEDSPRYRPDAATYCNVYAADFAALAGVYLPRVWWKNPKHDVVPDAPIYDVNVREMRANDLFDWFHQWGARFGWREELRAGALQSVADEGGVGVIIAKNVKLSASGHVAMVVPATDKVKPLIVDGAVVVPVQSCAGRRNQARFASRWWDRATFSAYSFWSHA